MRVAWLIARRELRSRGSGLWLFVACLALGVGTIAAVGLVERAVTQAISRDARTLMGGDLELENEGVAIEPAIIVGLIPPGAALTELVDLNSTVSAGALRSPVVVKAVDAAWPLLGSVELDPPMPIATALEDGGAVAEAALAARLGIAVGQPFQLGLATLTLRATLVREPDRVGGFVAIGPRLIVGRASLERSGILQPGAIVDYQYRFALPAGGDAQAAAAAAAAIKAAHPDASWRLRTAAQVQPRLAALTDRLATYLTLAGLTALLVGGLGIGLAVEAYLAGKTATIATLKSLGADVGQVVGAYLVQVMALAMAGIAAGLVGGVALATLLAKLPAALLPVSVEVALAPGPLGLAAAAGLLTTLAFALWPLGMAREVSPAGLWRSLAAPPRTRPRPGFLAALAGSVLLLASLAVAGVARPELGAWFVGIALVTALVVSLLARLLLRALGGLGEGAPLALRLAARNLRRPGSGAVGVAVALGAGLAVLTAVVVVQAALAREVERGAETKAPALIFIDIQPDQQAPFEAMVAATPGAVLRQSAPHLRARILRLGGVPVEQVQVAEEVRWTLNRDRGLTYRREPPPDTPLAEGEWWPADYAGPLLLSLDAEIATGYGLRLGDTITLNILGRTLEGRIANLRQDVDFASGRLEFFFIASPGVVDRAPHTVVATVEVPQAGEPALVTAAAAAFPNVTAIAVGPVIREVEAVLAKVGLATRLVALVTVLPGLLVLAGAIAAARRRQRYQTVVLKVLGASRATALRTLAAEYLLLGATAAALGVGLGTALAWALVGPVLDLAFTFPTVPVTLLAGTAMALVLGVGTVATLRVLSAPTAGLLRQA